MYATPTVPKHCSTNFDCFFTLSSRTKTCKPFLNTFLIGCLSRLFSYHPFFLLPTQSLCSIQVLPMICTMCICVPELLLFTLAFYAFEDPTDYFPYHLLILWKISSNLFRPQVHGIYVLFDYKCIDLRYFV